MEQAISLQSYLFLNIPSKRMKNIKVINTSIMRTCLGFPDLSKVSSSRNLQYGFNQLMEKEPILN